MEISCTTETERRRVGTQHLCPVCPNQEKKGVKGKDREVENKEMRDEWTILEWWGQVIFSN